VGPDDTLYVSDVADHRIRKISPDGVVTTLAGDGTAGFTDGAGTAARFNSPTGLALDAAGNLFVADSLNHAIRKIDPQGTVTTVAGDGTKGLADGTSARFNIPIGLVAAPDGSLYIADRDNNALRKLVGNTVSTVAGSQDVHRIYFDGPAATTRFNPPNSMAFGADGLLYFTTTADIYTLEANGEVHSYAGSAQRGYDDGVNFVAAFYDLGGLCFSPNDVMYVVDGNRIRAIVKHL
jgi:sugar lactone lactonase YvrE